MRRPSPLKTAVAATFAVVSGCDYQNAAPGQTTETPDVRVEPGPDLESPPPEDTATAPNDTASPPPVDVVTPPAPDAGPTEPPWQHPPIVGVETGTGEEAPLDPLAPVPEPRGRGRQRMDIDQLDAAFARVLDGITWTMRVGNSDVNQFQALSETLGKPDFLDTTFEDLAPTTLFQKFLNDGARKACADRVTADLALMGPEGAPVEPGAALLPVLFGTLGASDTLANAPERIEQQLSALLLRFHGHRMGPGDAGFAEWRWLFESSLQLTGSTATAWRATCVALLTHPDFYTY
jgi:hypothetical protein